MVQVNGKQNVVVVQVAVIVVVKLSKWDHVTYVTERGKWTKILIDKRILRQFKVDVLLEVDQHHDIWLESNPSKRVERECMTKIRALKDSPLAKQGEVFEKGYDCYPIGKFTISIESVQEWIASGWFEIVEEKKTLKRKLHEMYPEHEFEFKTYKMTPMSKTITKEYVHENFIKTAREHAIEIVKEANNEYNVKYFNGGTMDRSDYIIQKLKERMR